MFLACFHYQIKECKGICCDKETVENYNKRVKEAIKSVGIGAENLVIKEKGRTKNEVGFALILDGIYKGFGYVDCTKLKSIRKLQKITNFLYTLKKTIEMFKELLLLT